MGKLGFCRLARCATGYFEAMSHAQSSQAGRTGRRAFAGGEERGFLGGGRLTVGAASSSMRPQVEALFFSRSEMTPARIPPAMQRGRS